MVLFVSTLVVFLGVVPAQHEVKPTIEVVPAASHTTENRWGVADQSRLEELEQELLEILEGPVDQTRSGVLGERDKAAIESDPELFEAYRSAPAATLELIKRIRDAGGLQ